MSETTILVVHDDASFVDGIRSAVERAHPGVEVVTAISGPRGLGLAQQRRPVAVIADGDLVGMDGYDFTRELKCDDGLREIPVVIVTADPTEASALRARQVGAVAHVPATVDPAALLERLLGPGIPTPATGTPAPAPVDVPTQTRNQPVAGPVPYPAPTPASAPAPAPAAQPGDAGAPAAQPADAAAAPFIAAPRQASLGSEPIPTDLPHIDELLRMMLERGGSDLHVTVGAAPRIREQGDLVPVEGMPV
ncbi:MAG TPA: response regulator, partial [Coriobacteriia bacterium]|nr:response regulator [Coriobacteriia bacterium]